MESPLNVAHRQARKAEHLMKHEDNLDEAVANHKSAAENILLALEMSTSVHARESLRLQHAYHVKQEHFIHQAQCHRESKEREKCSPRKKSTDPMIDGMKEVIRPLSVEGGRIDRGSNDDRNIYQTMVETDSLLQFLNKHTPENVSMKNLDRFCNGLEVERKTNIQNMVESAIKRPKDDRTVMEELRVHNEELRGHICNMIRELELSREKNKQLQEQLDRRETHNTLLLDDTNAGIPVLQLPPLEMPNFDFESFKSDVDDVENPG